MLDLNAINEKCLGITLEGVWGEEVVLLGPDGVEQTVRGRVVRESESVSEDSRGISQGGRRSLVVTKSSVSLRTTSLSPIPDSEENWMCTIPVGPEEGAPTQRMFVEAVPQGSKTIGIITLRLTATKSRPIP